MTELHFQGRQPSIRCDVRFAADGLTAAGSSTPVQPRRNYRITEQAAAYSLKWKLILARYPRLRDDLQKRKPQE